MVNIKKTVKYCLIMIEFAVGERILLHLYNFRSVDLNDYFNIPWEITQDGIAVSLRISRAHVSMEMKRCKQKDFVTDSAVRIHGGKVRRLAYKLTDKGYAEALEITERAKNAGIDPRSLLDLKKQDASLVLGELPDTDRKALGVACAFRLSVPESILPEHSKKVIPSDVKGMTVIDPELRNRILRAANDKELREWHSWVSDYYDLKGHLSIIPDEDLRAVERIYHQLNAGLYLMAIKKIDSMLYNIVFSDDKGLYECIRDIPDEKIKPEHKVSVLTARAELALCQNDLKTARESGEKLIELEGGQEEGYACLTECLLLRKKEDEARAMIERVNGSGNALGMMKLADVFVDLGEIDKARDQLARGAEILSDNNEAANCQYYTVLARIDVSEGNMEEAAKHIAKANASANKVGKKYVKALARNLGVEVGEYGVRGSGSS